jgi:hypothetical protein
LQALLPLLDRKVPGEGIDFVCLLKIRKLLIPGGGIKGMKGIPGPWVVRGSYTMENCAL